MEAKRRKRMPKNQAHKVIDDEQNDSSIIQPVNSSLMKKPDSLLVDIQIPIPDKDTIDIKV